MSPRLCVKNDIREKGECDIVVSYLIGTNKAFLCSDCSIWKPIAPILCGFCVHAPAPGILLLPGFPDLDLKWATGPGLFLSCQAQIKAWWNIPTPLSEEDCQKHCGLPSETLPRWSQQNICVCVFALVLRTKHPFDIACASYLTLGCFRNDAISSWCKKHWFVLETGRRGIWTGGLNNRGEWIEYFR
jgi:hypothetical protein